MKAQRIWKMMLVSDIITKIKSEQYDVADVILEKIKVLELGINAGITDIERVV